MWFGRYDLARLAEIAQQWHEAHGRFSLERLAGTGVGNPADPLAWPSLLDSGASHGGLRVVELTSRAALELDGRRLQHCVASYAIKCLLAESAIFSIRDEAGAPLSTFEVRVPADGRPKLLRHHATANAPLGEREQAVARRFVERVRAQLHRERVRAVQQARRELGLRVRALLGKPDTFHESLTAEELGRLAEAITVAHPAEARRAGVVAYLVERGPAVLSTMGAGCLLSVGALSA